MATREDFVNGGPTFRMQVNGMFGSGKSRLAMTFPKVFYVGTEPGGIDFLHLPENRELLGNLVEYEIVLPDENTDIRELLKDPTVNKTGQEEMGRIYKATRRGKELYTKGEVKTLVLDNLTYLAEMKWMEIDKYGKVFSAKTGNLDTQAMYGNLARWLYRFVLTEICTFKGNVVVTCHLRKESEEAMAEKLDKTQDVVPNILGGFRNQSEGMFGASIYLERKVEPDKTRFIAYCEKVKAMGSTINAKNRYGLPAIVENVSYQTLMKAMTGEVVNKGGK